MTKDDLWILHCLLAELNIKHEYMDFNNGIVKLFYTPAKSSDEKLLIKADPFRTIELRQNISPLLEDGQHNTLKWFLRVIANNFLIYVVKQAIELKISEQPLNFRTLTPLPTTYYIPMSIRLKHRQQERELAEIKTKYLKEGIDIALNKFLMKFYEMEDKL